MTTYIRMAFLSVALGCVVAPVTAQKERPATIWLTDPSHSVFFQRQPEGYPEKGNPFPADPIIAIDEKKTFQEVDGFGWALTGGSAQHIMQMSPAARAALLRELFSTDSNFLGASYLRVSIGASDLNDHVFSYDDLPPGQKDTTLARFDLGPDKQEVVPVLREIIGINPQIRILGSPWSAPVWMKNNHDTRGGSLLPQYYPVYANYFVKYILAMQQYGIGIDAVTVQNEPLHPGNNPSMYMSAAAQAAFVKWLGQAIDRERLGTRIIVYDHNADRPDYPDSIYRDPEAAKWVDGAAFHLYGGKIEALTPLHEAHPDKNLYFTEQWVGAPGNFAKDIPEHVDRLIVGAMRNWCKTVIEWNLAADSRWEPHTDRGGCDRCLGAVTIDGDSVKRNPAYYIIAHAAKYVRPGSVRIQTNSDEQLPNVAFRTPAGQTVLIVLNNTASPKGFTIELRGRRTHAVLSGGAVATYVFPS